MRFSPLLLFHISAGIVGLLSGAAAASFRKGSLRHAQAGRVFVAAMLTMSASATYLAIMKSQMNNVFGGVLTFYLVATAWLTAKRRDGETSLFDWGALLVPLAVGVTLLVLGFRVVNGLAAPAVGVPVGMYFFLASVALLCAAGDVRMLLRGGAFGRQRIARHLWRMCFALYIAAGSFFLGQQKVLPVFVRGSPILFVPVSLPLLLMIFWLVRVRFTNVFQRTALPYRSVRSES